MMLFLRVAARAAVLLALAACLPQQASAQASSPPPAERWLPDETIAFASLPSATQARAAWSRQTPGRLLADPAMAPFRSHLVDAWKSRITAPLHHLTGLNLDRLLELTEGQLTLAILAPPSSPRVPGTEPTSLGIVLALDLGSNTNALAAELAAAPSRATELAAPPVSFTLLHTPVTRFQWPAKPWQTALDAAFPPPETSPATAASPTNTPPFELCLARLGSLLLLVSQPASLSNILARLEEPPTLPPHPRRVDPGSSPRTNTLASVWINGPLALATLTPPPSASSTPPAAFALPPADRVFAALGFRSVHSATYAVRDDPEGWLSELRLNVPAANRRGLLRIFEPLPADASPPPWIPDSILSFTRIRTPGPRAWQAFERLLRELDPAYLGVLQLFTQYAGKTEDADFDFDRGLIARLGDDWMAINARIPDTNTWGSDLIVHGSTNAPALFDALKLIASPTYLSTFLPPGAPAPARAEQTAYGNRFVSIAMPPMPWRGNVPGTYHLALRPPFVGLTGTRSSVDLLLNPTNPPSPLVENPAFRHALKRVGGPLGGWLGYFSERDPARQAFATLRDSTQPLDDTLRWAAISDLTTRLVAGALQAADFTLLPPFDTVADYFRFRVEAGRADETGLQWTTFRPVPLRSAIIAPSLPAVSPTTNALAVPASALPDAASKR